MLSYVRHNRLNRHIVGILLLALVLQAFLPILHHPAYASLLPTMRLCSAAASSADKVDLHKSLPQKSPSCPICQTMHLLGGGYVVPSSTVFVYHLNKGTNTKFATYHVLGGQAFIGHAQPRAPPVAV